MSIRTSNNPTEDSNKSSSNSSAHLQNISLQDLFQTLLRHKLLVIIPTLVLTSATYYYCTISRTFSATATLLVQRADNSSLQAITGELGAARFGMASSLKQDNYLETQILYLKSRDFFEFALEEAQSSTEGKMLLSLITKKRASSWLPGLLRRKSEDKISSTNSNQLLRAIKSKTQIEKLSSNAFQVKTSFHDERTAIQLSNFISETTLKALARRELKQLEEAKTYLNEKIDSTKESMSAIEKEMLTIRMRSFPISTQSAMQSNVQQIVSIQSELEQNKIKLDQNLKLIDILKDRLSDSNESSNQVNTSTLFSVLQRQLEALEARRRGLLAEGVAIDSSQMIDLQEEIDSTRTQFKSMGKNLTGDNLAEFLKEDPNPAIKLSNLQKENWYLRTRISAAEQILSDNKKEKENVPADEQLYYALTKRLEMNYHLLSDLSKNLFQIDVNRISVLNRFVKIENASNMTVSLFPGLTPALPLAFIASLLLGLLFTFVAETTDPVIKTRKDLPGVNYVFLGAIPDLSNRFKTKGVTPIKSAMLKHRLDLPETIPFKRIRTRILHLSKAYEDKIKVISILSAQSGDGKSFTAANTAASIAATNKRVLLVDTDLRCRALSRELIDKYQFGLSNILAPNSKVDPAQSVIKDLQPCLDFLPSGPPVTNSTELLNSTRFAETINYFRKIYDFIIIDNAPFMALPDAEIVGHQADMNIINVSCNRSKVKEIQIVMEHFLEMGDKALCITLNRSTEKTPLYYGTQGESSVRTSVAA